ncbi:MAG: hypothetical protein HC822_08390 [Oscillochloris sp.]|nr:hypothetical protein [Oscillochloris sp.]
MVDPMVQALLEQAIDSPVKLHLLLMFHENQRMEATARAIADRVCRDMWSVSQALHELAADGVMVIAASAHGEPVYRYEPIGTWHLPIARLIRGYDDPLVRNDLQRTIRELEAYAPYRRTSTWQAQVA